jgi:hypothetical protein
VGGGKSGEDELDIWLAIALPGDEGWWGVERRGDDTYHSTGRVLSCICYVVGGELYGAGIDGVKVGFAEGEFRHGGRVCWRVYGV